MFTSLVFQIACLLGALSGRKVRNDDFIEYKTPSRETGRRRVYTTAKTVDNVRCAANCAVLGDCDYYMYNTKQHICKYHHNTKQVLHHAIGKVITVYWKAHCGKPPRATHGRYAVTEGVAHYTCNDNFKLFGNNDIKCFTAWPQGPKCLRHYWRNPIQRKKVFHAKIPWGFRENGSISLSGAPKQRECSFTVFVGIKKASKPDTIKETFLLHLDVQVSEKRSQKIVIHTGSLADKKNVWEPKSPLYSLHKTTVLDIRMNRNDFQLLCPMQSADHTVFASVLIFAIMIFLST